MTDKNLGNGEILDQAAAQEKIEKNGGMKAISDVIKSVTRPIMTIILITGLAFHISAQTAQALDLDFDLIGSTETTTKAKADASGRMADASGDILDAWRSDNQKLRMIAKKHNIKWSDLVAAAEASTY